MAMKTPGSAGEAMGSKGARRQLKEIMSGTVQTVRPDAEIVQAAAKMKEQDVGAIPVCDGDRLVGMVTDRDITVRIVAERRDPATAKVQDAMTPDLVYCFED